MDREDHQFGRFVRARREELRLTQEQLAAACGGGISAPYIAQLERGTVRKPGDDKLPYLAHGLRVSRTVLARELGLIDDDEPDEPESASLAGRGPSDPAARGDWLAEELIPDLRMAGNAATAGGAITMRNLLRRQLRMLAGMDAAGELPPSPVPIDEPDRP